MIPADRELKPGLSIRHGGHEPPLPEGSLADILRSTAARFGDRPAVFVPSGDRIITITYAQLLERSENVAHWLMTRCQPGDRVAVWSNNAIESVLLQHACALAGMIIAHFNTGWTDTEARHAAEKIEPSIGFTGKGSRGMEFAPRLEKIADFPVLPLSDIGGISTQRHEGSLPSPGADTPFLIQFTSGTTGRAKAALLTQLAAMYGGWVRPAVYDGTETDVWLNPAPCHHIGGSIAVILGALTTASCFVVLESYDRDQIVRLMRDLRPSRMGGVPTMWHDILAAPDLPSDKAVKIVTLGGAIVPPSLVRQVGELTGATCAIGYGQSETGAATGTVPSDPIEVLCETIGHASPHMEVMIAHPETGQPVPYGEVGEICARGPGNMTGYWGDEAATAETIRPSGFLRTGDLGSMDSDGLIRIAGRLREVIIRGGENIYPAEVEAALMTHPDIDLAAAVRVENERLGHEVGAVIKLVKGASPDIKTFKAHAAEQIAHFKVPHHWQFIDEMPLTASGKIRKVELEKLFEQDT
ncbi:MAG: acyl--CoA ligase [Sphingomonadaceae bacterium]|nr:acyl--CoA ligase [Sphingomonadaceae bacterium]